ncbi:hypothetical protein NDU88_000017 [Pleurodeles waltl]|uniref:Uncharacterized protein n=1 Tax=Pleurodeles waltl TaxID=8319 RepID=A0AAV7VVJ4_PLEWA|nr:hypothetical protein NDU88_000017 [Pleurodeles waltl]
MLQGRFPESGKPGIAAAPAPALDTEEGPGNSWPGEPSGLWGGSTSKTDPGDVGVVRGGGVTVGLISHVRRRRADGGADLDLDRPLPRSVTAPRVTMMVMRSRGSRRRLPPMTLLLLFLGSSQEQFCLPLFKCLRVHALTRAA